MHAFRTLPRSRWLVAALLWALLGSQWLSLLHRQAHAPGEARPPALLAPASPASPSALLAVVDGHEAGSLVCQALDQFCHGGTLWQAPALPLPPWASEPPPPWTRAAPGARPWARPLARAPPLQA